MRYEQKSDNDCKNQNYIHIIHIYHISYHMPRHIYLENVKRKWLHHLGTLLGMQTPRSSYAPVSFCLSLGLALGDYQQDCGT